MTDQEIVDLANRVGKDLRGATFGEVCGHIDAVDVAWGVWQGGKIELALMQLRAT